MQFHLNMGITTNFFASYSWRVLNLGLHTKSDRNSCVNDEGTRGREVLWDCIRSPLLCSNVCPADTEAKKWYRFVVLVGNVGLIVKVLAMVLLISHDETQVIVPLLQQSQVGWKKQCGSDDKADMAILSWKSLNVSQNCVSTVLL